LCALIRTLGRPDAVADDAADEQADAPVNMPAPSSFVSLFSPAYAELADNARATAPINAFLNMIRSSFGCRRYSPDRVG
jgi:hypothetical protein